MGPSIHRQRESPLAFSCAALMATLPLDIVLCLYPGLFHSQLTAFGTKGRRVRSL